MPLRLFYDNPVSLGFALRRELSPRRSRRAAAAPPDRAARTCRPPTPAPRRRRTRARAGCSSRRSTPPRTRLDWSSAGFGFFDLRGEVAAIVPLPLYRRHTLTFDARGRDLAGAPAGERLLRVGGYVLQPLARRARTARDPPHRLPVPAAGRAVRRAAARLRGLPVRGRSHRDRQRHLPAADHHRLRLGIDPVRCCRRCSSGRSTSTCSRSRATDGHSGAAATAPPAARCRCSCAVLGHPDHPAVPARPPASRTIRRWSTWSSSASLDSRPVWRGASVFGWNSALV